MTGTPASARACRRAVRRDQRGWVVVPTPLVVLTALAVVAALIYFFASGGLSGSKGSSGQAAPSPSPSVTADASVSPTPTPTPTPSPTPTPTPSKKPKPKPSKSASKSPSTAPSQAAVNRQDYLVAVLNNTSVTGLAGRTASEVAALGWRVSGTSNWRGNIPSTTVYYPAGMQTAAEQLARDLGIDRLRPSVAPMKSDRLTVILSD